MHTVELVEEEATQIPENAMDKRAVLRLHQEYNKQIHIQFPSLPTPDHYILRSRGYIGQIAMAAECVLHIRPKVGLRNLFGMVEYAYQLSSFQLFDQATSCGTLGEFIEHLIAVLLGKVRVRAHRGLFRDYVEKEEDLAYLRGRFIADFSQTTTRAHRLGLRCRFQEQTTNLPDNQILAWTLHCLRRFPLQRPDLKHMIYQVFRQLSGAVDLRYIRPEDCLDRSYHRLNQDYEPMHALCRFFLEHSGPSLAMGDRKFMAFLVYMPALFESFIAEWLRAHLGGALALSSQYRVPLDGSERLEFRIDLVLNEASSGKVLAVMDTKYKRVEVPDEADIQQVVAYAVRMGTSRAILIYPSTFTRMLTLQVGNVRVQTLVFDLDGDLNESGELFKKQLLQGIDQEDK